MNLDQFKNSETFVKLAYVVFNENTIGILFKNPDQFMMEVLNSNVHGINPMNSPYMLGSFDLVPNLDIELREATLSDFDTFRVSPKGHLMPI